MPEIQYPKNPNSDTAFVVQEDGTKNRALMTAPQDTSTLELPSNANSTKGYVTVDGKKQRVILTADIGGGGSSLPDQTGHAGEYLTTDGTDASWSAVDALPDQTGQSGKFLTTDGTDASWSDKPLVNKSTNGTSILGYSTTGSKGISIGVTNTDNWASTRASGNLSIAIGAETDGSAVTASGNSSMAIGASAQATANGAIAIGTSTKATAVGAIQIGWAGTNSDAGTIKFRPYNTYTNYTLVNSDGTIPTARLTKVNTTATLAVADWSSNTQTITVSGVKADSVVFVSPAPASASDYASAGILCTSQSADSLTFTCTTTPTNAITVNVVCM